MYKITVMFKTFMPKEKSYFVLTYLEKPTWPKPQIKTEVSSQVFNKICVEECGRTRLKFERAVHKINRGKNLNMTAWKI